METIRHFIGGEWTDSDSPAWLDDVEPATGAVHARLARGGSTDVDRAVASATAAVAGWSSTPAAERSRLLLAVAEAIERDLEGFAHAESVDTGKPIALARSVDIPRAVANFRFFATAILHWSSESHLTDGVALNYTLRRPLGVVGLISPWNLPLYLLSWKIAPALAAGNTAVAKPSELTPLTAHRLTELCREVGLPPGVLNVVHGLGAEAGAALTAHPGIAGVSFTGGTATGRLVSAACGPRFAKVSLELGGKNPTLVFADADLDEALPAAVRAAFSNQGQICLCGSRILVERSIHDRFVDGFVEVARSLRSGDPLDERTEQGALISAEHLRKVEGYIALARDEGGRIVLGGQRPTGLPERCREGFFLAPTAITGLDAGCRVNREEIFGPVVSIVPFDDEAGAIAAANATAYGLAASLWTRDLDRAHRVAARLEAGTVWINCWMLRDLRVPFGGVKQSGLGREGGEEALRFFTEPKNVCLRLAEER